MKYFKSNLTFSIQFPLLSWLPHYSAEILLLHNPSYNQSHHKFTGEFNIALNTQLYSIRKKQFRFCFLFYLPCYQQCYQIIAPRGIRFRVQPAHPEREHGGDRGGGHPSGGLRGWRVAQAVLRLRGRQHLDDDLHRPLLRIQPHPGAVLLQVSSNQYIPQLQIQSQQDRCRTKEFLSCQDICTCVHCNNLFVSLFAESLGSSILVVPLSMLDRALHSQSGGTHTIISIDGERQRL